MVAHGFTVICARPVRHAAFIVSHVLCGRINYVRRLVTSDAISKEVKQGALRLITWTATLTQLYPINSGSATLRMFVHTKVFLYVATVLDLFSRRIVGWSMDKTMDRHLVIKALLMAVWKRQPKESVLVHSDQGSQYGSADYLAFMRDNNLEPSMSRRGNCHDNAVAESFFATFKKRVTQRKIYTTREEAKGAIFNFIEMFYNPIKRHSHTGGVSPVKFEQDYFSRLESV